MRTTEGKPVGERVLLGDPGIAEGLAQGLASREPVDRYTHGYHTWPAGLHPDAARDLLAQFPGRSVLDPFCGGGTVLVEALAAGRRVHGRDLSTVAVRVARARTSLASEEVLTRMRSLSRKLTEEARRADQFPPEPILHAVREWYAPHVLCELERIRKGLSEADPEVRPLLEVVFSSIVVKTSWRKSDTKAQREKHDRAVGTAAILFHKKARELGRRIAALREAVPPNTPRPDVRLQDSRKLTVPEKVDLVLTSPPYPSTYDYLPMQHLRRVWLSEIKENEDAEIGPRRLWREGGKGAIKRWREDTVAWTKACADALVPGGQLVVVIGDGYAPGSGEIDTSEPTEAAARAAKLVAVARASLERPDHARGTSKWEHAFLFRKP